MNDNSLPPGPRSRVPGRILATFARDRLGFFEQVARTYGDVAYFSDMGAKFALVSHPELARDVLVTQQRRFHKGIGLERAKLLLGEGLLTSEGEHHLRQRRMMQPAFHRDRIAGFAGTMSAYAQRRSDDWRGGQEIDVSREMMALTLAIAGKTLFDADVEGDTRAIGEALDEAIRSFGLVLLPYGDLLARLPIPPAIRFRRARAQLDAIIYRLVGERRAEARDDAEDRGDLLTMLVRARDDEGPDATTGMTDLQIRDEALTILLAGHETTANALTWSWYFLSQHPEAAARLHQEVDAVLTTPGGAPRAATLEDLQRLTYARMVVAESMRLRPPAYVLGRRALDDYQVPGTSWVIPRGATVFVSQHVLHRDPRYWPNPTGFDPARWEGDSARERPRFAYFPFGAGTRVCIGEQFAWMELTLALSTIARRWSLALVPGHPVQPEPMITLRARHGMRMIPARRA